MSAFTFRAVLAERSGFSRDRDGGTLRLEIAESDIADMIGVTALNRCVLRVTVAVDEASIAPDSDVPLQNNMGTIHALPKRPQREPRWQTA